MLNKLLFFLNRTWSDIFNPMRFGISDHYKFNANQLTPYGLDYTSMGMTDYYNGKLDDQGIFMMSHYIDHSSGNEQHYYSPVKIAHYALGCVNDFLKTKNETYLTMFWDQIRFLVENAIATDGKEPQLYWLTPSSNEKYNVDINYKSAIVQGLAISALLRAYQISGDKQYLSMAIKATPILNLPVKDGGCLAFTTYGDMYEEYPSEPFSHVINGFIFCLIGLGELVLTPQGGEVKPTFEKGFNTLINLLNTDDWINDQWSYYDLHHFYTKRSPNLATRHYQYLHIDLLNVLYMLNPHDLILFSVKKLEKQLKSPLHVPNIYINKFYKLLLKR